jgi:hypothetical protein
MPHRVHAMVQHVQSSGLDAVVDGIEGKSERHELPPGHHAVLSFGERRDQRILTAYKELQLDAWTAAGRC